jgi:hypothetical protein
MTFDELIEERFAEFNEKLEGKHLTAKIIQAGKAEEIARVVGEPVLFPSQIRVLANLLGYDGTERDQSEAQCHRFGAFMFSMNTYRKHVECEISKEGKILSTDHNIDTQKTPYVFKLNSVQEGLRKMGEKGKLDYSPERFDYALKKLVGK